MVRREQSSMNSRMSSVKGAFSLIYIFSLFVCTLFPETEAFGATFKAIKDEYVYRGAPSTAYCNTTVIYGGAEGDYEYEAYFKWDLSGLQSVTVLSATARFYCHSYSGNLMTPEVYKLTSYWNECTVTWNTRPSSTGPDVSHDDLDAPGWYEVATSGLATIVQSWIDSPGDNYGLVITHEAYGDTRKAGFRAREYNGTSDNTYTAELIVTYVQDTDGPYAPGNIRMSQSYDTAGESNSDDITYIGNPQFEWTKPSDRGTSGTKDYYQWAVTTPSDNPWDGPRITEGFTSNIFIQTGALTDGNYKFWVQAQDNANNWGDWGSTNFTIDTIDPTIPYGLTNPGGASSITDTTPNVTWSGGDDPGGSGLWTFDIRFSDVHGINPDHTYNSGDTNLDDFDFAGDPLEEGEWSWKVKAIDVAGNDSEWSAEKPLTVETDVDGPAISNWFVPNDDYGNVTIGLKATDASGVDHVDVYYSVNSTAYDRFYWLNYQGNEMWSNTLPDTFDDNDDVYIKVTAVDKSFNANNTTEEYPSNPHVVKREGPYAPGNIRMSPGDDTGQSSSDGITYIGNPPFEWTKPSDRGTSGTKDYYQWAVTTPSDNPWDGPRIADGFTSNTYIQLGTLGDNNYKFWVQAQDNANNWGDWGSTNFTIDTVDPTIPYGLTNPGGSSSTTDTTPNVTWSGGNDPGGSGLWTFDIRFSDVHEINPDHTYNSGDTNLDDFDFTGDPLEEGEWSWKVKAIDVAGNDSEWSTSENLFVMTGPRSINISLAAERQQIDGFGGSFAMWGYNPDSNAISKVISELGVTIVRTRGDEWEDPDEWQKCLNVLQAARDNGADKFLLSFWTPPSEYKIEVGNEWHWDNSGDNPSAWASEIASRVADFNDAINQGKPNVEIFLSSQNEPDYSDGSINCKWSVNDLGAFIPILRSLLDNAGLTEVKILSPETTNPSNAADYITEMAPYPPDVYAYHLYGCNEPDLTGLEYFAGLTTKSWQTETSGRHNPCIPGTYTDELENAIYAAKYIHHVLCDANSNAFLWWGLTWAESTSPPVPPSFDRHQGLVLVDHTQDPMPIVANGLTKKYFAFKQYSKYVKPGYVRLDLSGSNVAPLLVSAYKSPNEQIVVLVITNPESYDVDVSISGLESYNLCKILRTDNDSNCQESVWDETAYSKSVTTLVFDADLLSADIDGDSDVDFADIKRLATHWLVSGCSCPEWCEGTDLNKSELVDFADFAELAEYWHVDLTP